MLCQQAEAARQAELARQEAAQAWPLLGGFVCIFSNNFAAPRTISGWTYHISEKEIGVKSSSY